MGTWNDEDGAGYGLMLDGDGALTLAIGDGAGGREQITTGVRMLKRHWSFVAASFDAATGASA